MDVAITPAFERIARVLAGRRISANGEGHQESASRQVDSRYEDYLADAVAVLKTLREPSEAMARAGDPAVWEAMILAAIDEAAPQGVTL